MAEDCNEVIKKSPYSSFIAASISMLIAVNDFGVV